jgi:hypothetical protein
LGAELRAFAKMIQFLEDIPTALSETFHHEFSYNTERKLKEQEGLKLHLTQWLLYLQEQLNNTEVIMIWHKCYL